MSKLTGAKLRHLSLEVRQGAKAHSECAINHLQAVTSSPPTRMR
jgi:hypothetical protein